jgi:hypothetical protein
MSDNIDDLINAIRLLYDNKKAWDSYSNLSIQNFKCNDYKNYPYALRLQLEKIIIRHKRKIND